MTHITLDINAINTAILNSKPIESQDDYITQRTQHLINNEKCWVSIEDQDAQYTGAWAESVTINVELERHGKEVTFGRILNAVYTDEYDQDTPIDISDFEGKIVEDIENAIYKMGYDIADMA